MLCIMLSKLNKAKLLSVLQSDRKIHFGVAYTPKITRLGIVNVNNTFLRHTIHTLEVKLNSKSLNHNVK